MKRERYTSTYVVHVLSLSVLVLLPGCSDWLGGQSDKTSDAMTEMAEHDELEKAAIEVLTEGVSVIDKDELTGEVLISMNGKPVVTTDSLETEKEKLFEANPQLKQMIAFMDPAQLDRNLAEGLMNQAMVDQYISEKGIDKTAAYQKELKEGFKAVERMVNTKFFTQSFDVKVTDADVRKFYDENKDLMPELVVARGGVKAVGLQFENEQDARAFEAQVTAEGGDFKKAVEAQGMMDRVREFIVNDQSMGIDADLKAKILAITTIPSVEVVTINDKNVWVVNALGNEEVQYRPFDQVKAGLKDYLEKESRAKTFDKEMETLRKRYNVEIKADFLTAPAEEEMGPDALMQAVDGDFDDAADTLAFYEQQMSESV